MARMHRLGRSLVVVTLTAVVAFAGGMTFSSSAWAQDGDGSDSSEQELSQDERAREVLKLVRKGKKASKAEKYEKALGYFERAYELYPKPAILVRLGETAQNLDRVDDAIGYYETFVDKAPEDRQDAVEKIEERIETLKQSRPATVDITTKPEGASIRIGSTDSEPIGESPVSTELGPGETTLFASKDGYEASKSTVTFEAGEERSVTLELEETTSQETRANTEQTDRSDKPKALHEVSPNEGWNDRRMIEISGWTTGALGLAGLGAGVLSTVLKSQAARSYNNYNPNQSDATRRQWRNRALSRHRMELIMYSTGGFLTAVGTSLLTYHFVTRSGGDVSTSTARVRPRGGAHRDGAWAGLQLNF